MRGGGDFSRNTFRPDRHYSRVLMQQGRVLLDSDWNEQGSILLYYLQSLAKDLIGLYGGPATNCGFRIIVKPDSEIPANFPAAAFKRNFIIGGGHYYVDGILCENESFRTYARSKDKDAQALFQADYLAEDLTDGSYLPGRMGTASHGARRRRNAGSCVRRARARYVDTCESRLAGQGV